jgi:hypothetical protein
MRIIGAGVPEIATLNRVPDCSYEYAYVNREPVLVVPSARRIVYVHR